MVPLSAAAGAERMSERPTVPATTEIPSVVSVDPPAAVEKDPHSAQPSVTDGQPTKSTSAEAATSPEIEEYKAAQANTPGASPRFHSLHEFLNEAGGSSPIGLELREDSGKLTTGEKFDGLAIMDVRGGSPAAKAGLRPARNTTHAVLEGATLVAALVFPPAILATAILDQTKVGESYDMLIGVDGKRVYNLIDFEDQMRDAKSGDIVYLTIVRGGQRVQVPVLIPPGAAWAY